MQNDLTDQERLAALLDGTLSPEDRARVLDALARSDDAYEDLLETSAVLGEVTAHAAPPQRAQTNPWLRRALVASPFLLAAGIAAVVLMPREGREDVAAVGALLTVIQSVEGADHSPAAWTATRGGGEGAGLSAEAIAFRLGARFADLELAFRAGDSSAVRSISSAIAALAETLPTGAQVSMRARHLGGEGMTAAFATPVERQRLASELRALSAEVALFDLGVLTESARRAAHAGQANFFASTGVARPQLAHTLGVLERERRPSTAGGRAAVFRVRRVGNSAGGDLPLASLAATLDSAVADGGR